MNITRGIIVALIMVATFYSKDKAKTLLIGTGIFCLYNIVCLGIIATEIIKQCGAK